MIPPSSCICSLLTEILTGLLDYPTMFFSRLNPSFLWPEEHYLMHYFMMVHNDGSAWETSERGHFQEDFFPPVDIPVIPHKPWVQCNIPIPPGLYDKLCW